MTGLMTINSLIKALLNEVLSGDMSKYLENSKKKSQATICIKNRSYDDNSVSELRTHILNDQIALLRIYSQRLDRIRRIIDLLQSGTTQSRIMLSKELENKKETLVSLLNAIHELLKPRVFGKNLIEIVDAQNDALLKNDYSRYLSFVEKETNMVLGVYDIIKNLDIDYNYINYRRLSINQRKISILNVLLAAVFFTIISLDLSGAEVVKSKAAKIPKSLKDSDFRFIDVHMDNGRTLNLMKLIKEYVQKDMTDDGKTEEYFEKEFNVNVLGDYTVYDLAHVTDVVTKIYGAEGSSLLPKIGVKRIIFIPGIMVESNDTINGIAVPGGNMFLTGIRDSTDTRGEYTFEHELGHFIHYYLRARHKDFDKEWRKIKGGHVWESDKSDICEDVANTFATFSQVKGIVSDMDKLRKFGIPDNDIDGVMAKLALLKKYYAYSIKLLE